MRIILSRKGFDSSPDYGRVPSPIFPDGDSMLSIPIPGTEIGVSYDKLRFQGMSVGKVVEDLTRSRATGKPRIRGSHLAHLDPDLRADALQRRSSGWRALFGQADRAQSHLSRKGVGAGDLFLFFGWFRRVIDQGARWRFDPDAPDLHVIWGWLQVARVLPGGRTNRSQAPRWAQYFDHFQSEHPDFQERQYNAVYVARRKLKMPGFRRALPGAGVFPRFDRTLCLTKSGQPYRSVWKLPRYLAPRDGESMMTYHPPNRWRVRGDSCTLQSVGRGQEFVIDTHQCRHAVTWARTMFSASRVP